MVINRTTNILKFLDSMNMRLFVKIKLIIVKGHTYKFDVCYYRKVAVKKNFYILVACIISEMR